MQYWVFSTCHPCTPGTMGVHVSQWQRTEPAVDTVVLLLADGLTQSSTRSSTADLGGSESLCCAVLCTGIAHTVPVVPATATAETSFPLECSVSYFFYSDYSISLVAHTWTLFLQLCSLSSVFLFPALFFCLHSCSIVVLLLIIWAIL